MNQGSEDLNLFSLTTRGLEEKFFKKFKEENCNDVNKFKVSLLQNSISDEEYKIADFLLDKKCNIDNQDDKGYTALHYVLGSKNVKNHALVDKLLEANPNLELEDYEYGNTPLMEAVMNAKIPLFIIKRLLEMGADPHHKNKADVSPYDMVKKFNIPELTEIFKPYV